MADRSWDEVRELGDRIGYGELMSVASIIWAAKLIDQGLPDEGAFYPTAIFNMKESNLTKGEVDYRKKWIEEYRKYNNPNKYPTCKDCKFCGEFCSYHNSTLVFCGDFVPKET